MSDDNAWGEYVAMQSDLAAPGGSEGGAERVRAPFPYFGGKSKIAVEVWERFGDVANYVEPFLGSAAMLLARPHEWWKRTETVNDADGLVANFWRAVQDDPDAVAQYADWPVNENDLHARHAWLVARKDALGPRLEGDPDYYDAKIAGWWLWGMCAWIGSGWCSGAGPWRVVDGKLVHLGDDGQGINRNLVHLGDDGRGINRNRVHLGDDGQGINRNRVHLGTDGQGINRKRVHLGNDGQGHCEAWSTHMQNQMYELADRLRRVRVCCGDWSRVCGPTPTVKLGLTGVFLDPPYSHEERESSLYRVEMAVADEVREWAVEWGNDPRMRIALCGYKGEHEMPSTWEALAWKAHGGYGSQGEGRGRENAAREVIWFSPNCLKPNRPQQVSFL